MKVLRNKRILVVDDQEVVRMVVAHLLRDMGAAEVVNVSSVAATLDLLRRGRFDLIISDIEMEPLSGLHLLKRIRSGATAARHVTPVMLLTSHSGMSIVRKAIELDADGFLVKPVRPAQLEMKVQEALESAGSKRGFEYYAAIEVELEHKVDVLSVVEPPPAPPPVPEPDPAADLPTGLLPGNVASDIEPDSRSLKP
jgi:CheY-like chemotaxis protein